MEGRSLSGISRSLDEFPLVLSIKRAVDKVVNVNVIL